MKPVYVNGPLRGERFDTNDAEVQAIGNVDGQARWDAPLVTYRFREIGFHMGGKMVMLDIGFCGPEPDAETVARALLREDVFERATVRSTPPDLPQGPSGDEEQGAETP